MSQTSLSDVFAIALDNKLSLIYKSQVMTTYKTDRQIAQVWFGLDSTIANGDGQFTIATATEHDSSLYAISLYKLSGLTLYPYQLNAFLVPQAATLTFNEGAFTFISSDEKLNVFKMCGEKHKLSNKNCVECPEGKLTTKLQASECTDCSNVWSGSFFYNQTCVSSELDNTGLYKQLTGRDSLLSDIGTVNAAMFKYSVFFSVMCTLVCFGGFCFYFGGAFMRELTGQQQQQQRSNVRAANAPREYREATETEMSSQRV